jgi:hypothetical protein
VFTAPQVPANDPPSIARLATVETVPRPMPQWLVSTMHDSLNAPQAQSQLAERDSSPVRNDDDLIFPESRKRPHQSLTPSPSPQRGQISVPKRNVSRPPAPYTGPRVSAYAFGDDPDANWSTITKPEKNKRKSFNSAVARCSGPFRLPAPAVGHPKGKSKDIIPHTEKKQGTQATRRVITYLPPPPPQRTVAPSEIPRVVGEHYDSNVNALHVVSLPAPQLPQESGLESPPLQADSDDLTLVGEVDEHVLAFDAGKIEARYPKIRKLAKEVRACRDIASFKSP